MIEDVKGYKPHTTEKVDMVNEIKAAEQVLGKIFNILEVKTTEDCQVRFQELLKLNGHVNGVTDENERDELDQLLERAHQVQKAKDALKESSMWACRAVFQPEETY